MTNDFPRSNPDLEVDPPIDDYRIVNNPAMKKYFRLGAREAGFLESLDGDKSIEELRASNVGNFTDQEIDYLLKWFGEQRLLHNTPDGPEPEAKTTSFAVRTLDALANSDRWRITLASPDALLNRHRAIITALFSRPAMAAMLLICLAPAILFIVRPELAMSAYAIHDPMLSVTGWIALYLMILLMNAVHEFAHALACKHFGGKVERIGLMFMYLHPVAFCDVSDSWRFRERSHKLAVTGAGIFAQSVLTGAALTVWMLTGSSLFAQFAILNTAIALFNFFPFVKLDGYWMLVHLLGEPNLKSKSLAAVDGRFRSAIGRPRIAAGQARRGLLLFGIAHLIAVPAFWTLGLLAIYRLASHLSSGFAMFALCVVGGLLAYRAVRGGASYVRTLRER